MKTEDVSGNFSPFLSLKQPPQQPLPPTVLNRGGRRRRERGHLLRVRQRKRGKEAAAPAEVCFRRQVRYQNFFRKSFLHYCLFYSFLGLCRHSNSSSISLSISTAALHKTEVGADQGRRRLTAPPWRRCLTSYRGNRWVKFKICFSKIRCIFGFLAGYGSSPAHLHEHGFSGEKEGASTAGGKRGRLKNANGRRAIVSRA